MDKQACELIIEGLRTHDFPLRLDSFSKIHLIAESLGPERTRNELLPYILEFSDDEDAILLEILNQMATFVPYLGGPQYIQYTFDIFETYMLHDDPQVHTRAIEVFISYFPQLDGVQIVRYVLPVIRHLVLSEWYLGRMAVCTILPHVYPLCPKQLQNELCAIFSSLALDEHPLVRKSVCQQFGLLATFCLNDPKLARILYHLVIHASKDVQDTVRMASVDACIIVSDILRHYNAQHKALTVLFSLATDISWRVRFVVARRYPLILASLDLNSFTGDETAENFAKLLQDHESEVRTAAAGVFGRVCCLLGPDKTGRYLVPLLKSCSEDLHDSVRIALSRDFLYACNTLPQYLVNDVILPLFQQLLNDQRSEVKLNLMSCIHLLKPHVTEESLFKTMLPSIIELSQHTNWRIRVNVTQQYVILANQLSQQIFVQRLLPIALCQLCDPVASVRYGAIANFFKFTVVYGTDWCRLHLLPRLQALSQHQSYTHRLSAALALTGLLQIFPLDIIQAQIWPIMTILLSDRVSNIQLLSLRGVALILSRLLQFAPREHVWLQQDQLFSFTDNNSSGDSSTTHSTLILQVLLHNIKQRAFWEQTQYMLPTLTNNAITLVDRDNNPMNTIHKDNEFTTPNQTPQKQTTLTSAPHTHLSQPGPNAHIKANSLPKQFVSTRLLQQMNKEDNNNNNKEQKNTIPVIPSLHSYLSSVDLTNHQASIYGDFMGPQADYGIKDGTNSSNNNNTNSNNDHNGVMVDDDGNPADVHFSAFSDLLELINSPDFNLSTITTSSATSSSVATPIAELGKNTNNDPNNSSPTGLAAVITGTATPLSMANEEAKFSDTININHNSMVQTVQDTALSLRDYMQIINLYIKKTRTSNDILQRVLENNSANVQHILTTEDLPHDSTLNIQTIPFHLLSSSLNPQPGSNGNNPNGGGSGAGALGGPNGTSGNGTPRHGAELYVFLLLKRLREDYRRIIRETINIILVKLKECQDQINNGIDDGKATTTTTKPENNNNNNNNPDNDNDTKSNNDSQDGTTLYEQEANLLQELNYLRSLLTLQYQQDLVQDRYLFHITPVVYQLQQQKRSIMNDLIDNDARLRSTPVMIQFKSELMTHLDHFRFQKSRGGAELTVFANETFHLIQQLDTPLLQSK